MYIDRIVISDIRIISNLTIRFKAPYHGWHVILGDNGSGKSTFIRSVALALIGPNDAIALRSNWKDWLNKDSDEGLIRLDVAKQDLFDKYSGKSAPMKNYFIPNLIRFSIDPETDTINISGNYNSEKQNSKLSKLINAGRYNWGKGSGWFSAAYGPFRRFTGGNSDWNKIYYSSPKVGAHLSVFGEDIALTEAIEWIKELDYKRLKEKEISNNVSDAEAIFQSIKHFINNSGLLPYGASFEKVEDVPIFKDGDENLIPVTQLSDGYRSILSLTFEMIRQLIKTYGQATVFKNIYETNKINVPGVVLIDEIDAHLHPAWQTKIGFWFTEHFPLIQFIVTTHSPLVCRACDKGSIWRLKPPGGDLESGEVKGNEKDKLVFGNILDAFGTELFGKAVVRSDKSNEKLERLGSLNMLFALGKITDEEVKERLELQKTLNTDDPISP